ncbi:hypothetical protein VC88_09355 [Geobacillus sp. A8]|nr:hypothetical protein ABH20_09690 [Geobacillus sp. T6]RAN22817.1 hypothetical protein VC88_09355 [Geobacillus sp. A8]
MGLIAIFCLLGRPNAAEKAENKDFSYMDAMKTFHISLSLTEKPLIHFSTVTPWRDSRSNARYKLQMLKLQIASISF